MSKRRANPRSLSSDTAFKADPDELFQTLMFNDMDTTVPSLDEDYFSSGAAPSDVSAATSAAFASSSVPSIDDDAMFLENDFLDLLEVQRGPSVAANLLNPRAQIDRDGDQQGEDEDDGGDDDDEEDDEDDDEENDEDVAMDADVDYKTKRRTPAPAPAKKVSRAPAKKRSPAAKSSSATSASAASAAPSIATSDSTASPADSSSASGQKTKPKRKITPRRQERNRDSARKFRQRKKEYISGLEEEVRVHQERAKTFEDKYNQSEGIIAELERRYSQLAEEMADLRRSLLSTPSPAHSTSSSSSSSASVGKMSTRSAKRSSHVAVEEETIQPTANKRARRGTVSEEKAPESPSSSAAAVPSTTDLPRSVLMSYFAMPQFRALALLVLMAAMMTFTYGPDLLNMPVSLPLGPLSIDALHQRLLDTEPLMGSPPFSAPSPSSSSASSSSAAAASAANVPYNPWTPPSDASSLPSPSSAEHEFYMHISAQLSASSYTAAIGSVLLMALFDPNVQKWKPYVQAI